MRPPQPKLRIGIDLTPLLPVATGVDQYLTQLVQALAYLDHEAQFVVFINREDREHFVGKVGKNVSIIPIAIRSRLIRLMAQQIILPVKAMSLRLDVIHSPSFLMPLFKGTQKHLLTVFDMTMFSLPSCHIWYRQSRWFLKAVAMSICRADLITVPSNFVKKEIIRLMPDVTPDRIEVVPYGVGANFSSSDITDTSNLPPSIRKIPSYMLFVGTIEPRKNIETLIKSYRKAVVDHQVEEHLVLTGKFGWNYSEVKTLANMAEIRNRVHFTGYVNQETLVSLYRNARLFIYPPLEEGFGFPPLEAMACGIPTVASKTSSLEENLTGAALLVDPRDPEGLTAAMIRGLRSHVVRESLRREGFLRAQQFTWGKTAQMTFSCYHQLAVLRAQRGNLYLNRPWGNEKSNITVSEPSEDCSQPPSNSL